MAINVAVLPSTQGFEKVLNQSTQPIATFSTLQEVGAALSPSVLVYTSLRPLEQFTKALVGKINITAAYDQIS